MPLLVTALVRASLSHSPSLCPYCIMSVSIVINNYLAVTTYRPTRSSHGQLTPPSSTATWWPDPSHHFSVPTPMPPGLASSRTSRSATGTWWRSAVSFWCLSLLALRRQSRSQRSPGKITCQYMFKYNFVLSQCQVSKRKTTIFCHINK